MKAQMSETSAYNVAIISRNEEEFRHFVMERRRLWSATGVEIIYERGRPKGSCAFDMTEWINEEIIYWYFNVSRY